jgi:signal recognition particle receptor subunit beta
MAIVNEASLEAALKIVYCGAPLAGKSTNLHSVHSQLPEAERGDLVAVSNSTDQIHFFDFHPSDGIDLHGYRLSFQLYTVPGRVTYNATRQLVLREVDGIVFVVDSQPERFNENIAALDQMAASLSHNGIDPRKIPIVAQYNKQDLPSPLTPHRLEEAFQTILGTQPLVTLEANAAQGFNVFETLNASAVEVLNRFKPPTPGAPQKRSVKGRAALSS